MTTAGILLMLAITAFLWLVYGAVALSAWRRGR